ncbi:uncharacterized protein LOC121875192 [Homarus americanus]|uniref:uncharacterized protein LOC121875192 n=1 Tax=Homarus americanus TaxID=6706 RepID=UPI001C442076|nr:uncharacterized protein LOC121875192 [Homarus americanus]
MSPAVLPDSIPQCDIMAYTQLSATAATHLWISWVTVQLKYLLLLIWTMLLTRTLLLMRILHPALWTQTPHPAPLRNLHLAAQLQRGTRTATRFSDQIFFII